MRFSGDVQYEAHEPAELGERGKYGLIAETGSGSGIGWLGGSLVAVPNIPGDGHIFGELMSGGLKGTERQLVSPLTVVTGGAERTELNGDCEEVDSDNCGGEDTQEG